MLHTLRLSVFIVFLFALPALAQSPSAPRWVAALREGGNVIVMRHGATHADQVDAKPFDPSDTVHQRQLTDEGRASARIMGAALHGLNVPVSGVQTSLYYRAVETGTLLGFGTVSASEVLTEGGMGMAAKEDERHGAELRVLAALPPPAGTNVILVTHKPNIVGAFGKAWSDVREGEASIFRPDGTGSYTLIARVLIQDWTRLAQVAN
jgi:phosphohistidine phosphatase SixA